MLALRQESYLHSPQTRLSCRNVLNFDRPWPWGKETLWSSQSDTEAGERDWLCLSLNKASGFDKILQSHCRLSLKVMVRHSNYNG
jgi:hypothetical protein